MQPNHPLAIAARMVDDLSEAKGYEEACKEIGLDVADVEYMAEQRAMRMWLLIKGGPELLQQYANANTAVSLPPRTREDKQLIAALTTISAAGIALGWAARSVSDGFLLNDETHWR